MPELPEVEALAGFLREHARGKAVTRVDLAAISALKTFDPPIGALQGLLVEDVTRRGKFLDLDVSGLHLVIHLARAGWLRWSDALPPAPPRPGKGPLAARVHLDGGSGFDLTEAGTRKKLAIYLVRRAADVPGVARLGPDPLDESFTVEALADILHSAPRTQIKGLLRDQSVVAGIGNAYSDEVLHAAKLSPYKLAGTLDGTQVARLHHAMTQTLAEAVARAEGLAAKELKDDKRTSLRVHGRAGQPCPVCGDTIREVSFADSAFQYCPTCQTGGKPLADRRLSRLLR